MTVYGGKDVLDLMELAPNYHHGISTQIISHLHDQDRILDFGAGKGLISDSLREKGYQVECYEIDPELCHHLADKGYKVTREINHLSDNDLTFIYSINVLEHIEDDLAHLKLLLLKLRPGGRLLLYVPAFNMLYSEFDKKIGHFRRYQRQDLIQKVEQAGFKIHKSYYTDPIGFVAALAFKVLFRSQGLNKKSVTFFDKFLYPLNFLIEPISRRLFGKNLFLYAIKQD